MQALLFGVIKSFGLILLVSIAGMIAFLYSSSIDKSITSGSAYGITIGNSKQTIFTKLPAVYENAVGKNQKNSVTLHLFFEEPHNPTFVSSKLSELDYSEFESSNSWQLFFNTTYFFDSVTLEFCDSKLCEIKRYRYYLEYP